MRIGSRKLEYQRAEGSVVGEVGQLPSHTCVAGG